MNGSVHHRRRPRVVFDAATASEMILPVFKLGALAVKTFCKPIANRLKKEAGLHPRFRQHIITIAQVLITDIRSYTLYSSCNLILQVVLALYIWSVVNVEVTIDQWRTKLNLCDRYIFWKYIDKIIASCSDFFLSFSLSLIRCLSVHHWCQNWLTCLSLSLTQVSEYVLVEYS